jgi:hypothetical protein
MKRISIKVLGNEHELTNIQIKPGVTVGEVLAQLNLEDYVLSPLPNPNQLLSFLEDEEDLYSLKDGTRLYAIASSEAVDAYIHHFIYGSF